MILISEIISEISNNNCCEVFVNDGLPAIPSEYLLPNDIKLFYQSCGGIKLFSNKDYHWRILGPKEIQNACKTVHGEASEHNELMGFFVIAEDGNGDYLAINLSKNRNGCVVDAFHETFGDIGDTPVIALSFTELLSRLYKNSGEYPYWLENKDSTIQDWYFKNY